MLPCFIHFCSPLPDEQCEAAASSSQPYPLPAAVWRARKQPASRYPGCKCCLWWGQEEPLLWPPAGAGATAGELHERRLSKRPVIWLRPQFAVQGEGWNADLTAASLHTQSSPLSLQWQWFNMTGFLRNMEMYEIRFYSFPGLGKYWKQVVFHDYCPYFVF